MKIKKDKFRPINCKANLQVSLQKNFRGPEQLWEIIYTHYAIFQQLNTAIYTSKPTKNWFKTKNIDDLYRPTNSPDLNPRENLWGILSGSVYKNKRQFEDRETLKSCIKQYWNEIPSETPRKLIDSIQNKCVDVLQLNKNKCKYWILYNFVLKYKF